MKLFVAIAAAAVMSSTAFAENIVKLYKGESIVRCFFNQDSGIVTLPRNSTRFRCPSISNADNAENGEVSQEFVLDGHCHSNLAGFKGFALDAVSKNIGDFEACSYGHRDANCGPEYRPYPLDFTSQCLISRPWVQKISLYSSGSA
jgi:hypothetical protein